MAKYEIRFRQSVSKDLRRLPKQDVALLLQRITSLADNPRPSGCEKLTNKEWYRIRQGIYRIVYEIQDQVLVVIVVKIGHRREVYKNL